MLSLFIDLPHSRASPAPLPWQTALSFYPGTALFLPLHSGAIYRLQWASYWWWEREQYVNWQARCTGHIHVVVSFMSRMLFSEWHQWQRRLPRTHDLKYQMWGRGWNHSQGNMNQMWVEFWARASLSTNSCSNFRCVATLMGFLLLNI